MEANRLEASGTESQHSIEDLIGRVSWAPLPVLGDFPVDLLGNRREEVRYQVDVAAKLVETSDGEVREVRVTNVSRSGVGIASPFALRVGSTAVVVFGNTVVSGQVRWCRMDGEETYLAGVLAKRVGYVQDNQTHPLGRVTLLSQ